MADTETVRALAKAIITEKMMRLDVLWRKGEENAVDSLLSFIGAEQGESVDARHAFVRTSQLWINAAMRVTRTNVAIPEVDDLGMLIDNVAARRTSLVNRGYGTLSPTWESVKALVDELTRRLAALGQASLDAAGAIVTGAGKLAGGFAENLSLILLLIGTWLAIQAFKK